MKLTRAAIFTFCLALLWLLVPSTSAAIEFTNLYNFPFGSSVPNGSQAHARVVQGSDGALYGTASYGGIYGVGTVFKMTTTGKLIWSFSFNGTNGANPLSELIQGKDGCFYGTTSAGGAFVDQLGSAAGTVFKITGDGKLVWSSSFDRVNGAKPSAGLIVGPDGKYYGTTASGGAYDFGTVFRITSKGQITSLYSFTGAGDGAYPVAGLVWGGDGFFYGTAYGTSAQGVIFPDGPVNPMNFGSIFKISPGGELTVLYTFGSIMSSTNGLEIAQPLDGGNPSAELLLGKDGCLYGTTIRGGLSDRGTFFKITSGGDMTLLWSFTGPPDDTGTVARLIEGRDGNFYGTTTVGGTNNILNSGFGTIFQITSDGDYATLFYFDGDDGAFPSAGLYKGSDGMFYGTTAGGFYSAGTVFKFSITEHECPGARRHPIIRPIRCGHNPQR